MKDVFREDFLKNNTTYAQTGYADMMFGDLIGTNYTFKYLKEQFSDVKFYIVETEFLKTPTKAIKKLLSTLNGIDGFISQKEYEKNKNNYVEMKGFPIWLVTSLIQKISPPNDMIDIRNDPILKTAYNYIHRNKIVTVSPITDAGDRNPMRNWSPIVITDTINMFLNKGYMVVGLRSEDNRVLNSIYSKFKNNKKFIELGKSLYNSIRATCASNIFVGGDTGLTHFASNLGKYGPKTIIAYYAQHSKLAYWEVCGWEINKYRSEVFNNKYADMLNKYSNSSAPKISNEQILYLFMETSDMNKIKQSFKDAEIKGYEIPNISLTKKEVGNIKEFILSS